MLVVLEDWSMCVAFETLCHDGVGLVDGDVALEGVGAVGADWIVLGHWGDEC